MQRAQTSGMATNTSTTTRAAFLALAAAGLVLPWVCNIRYFVEGGGILPGDYFAAAFANALTTAITLDVYLAAITFSLVVALDRAAGVWRWWALPLTFFIGLAFALPAYAWWRTASRDRSTPAA